MAGAGFNRSAALIGASAAALVSACSVGPDYLTPDIDVPARFSSDKLASSSAYVPSRKWWRALRDAELNALVERAIINNPILEVALDRVQMARTQEAVILGTSLPVMAGTAGGGRGTGRDISRSRSDSTLVSADSTSGLTQGLSQINYTTGLVAGWELDLFGRYRRALEAAEADTGAAIAARSGTIIAVIADTARAYVGLRGYQMQLSVLRENIAVAKKYVGLTNDQTQRGITNELDLALANRQLATLEAEVEPLKAQIEAQKAVLAVLTGRYPEEIKGELSMMARLPHLPANPGKTIPYELLQQRPDVIEAERNLAGATALVGVATSNLFPRVALTGGWGMQGQGLGIAPVVSSYIWSFGPAVSWSLLDFGTLDNLINIADLHTKALLSEYKATILNAVREVDTSLATYHAQLAKVRMLKEAKTAASQAVSLATERFERGVTDSLNVILAQRELYNIERDYVFAQQSAAEQYVALHKALGGGWEDYQDLPDIPRGDPALIAAFKRGAKPAHLDLAPRTTASTQ